MKDKEGFAILEIILVMLLVVVIFYLAIRGFPGSTRNADISKNGYMSAIEKAKRTVEKSKSEIKENTPQQIPE